MSVHWNYDAIKLRTHVQHWVSNLIYIVLQVSLFIDQVKDTQVGFTVFNLFLIDKSSLLTVSVSTSGSAFIKPDQLDPWIKDQIKITLLPANSHLLLPNFVSCGRACPSHMTQNLVTVGANLWTAERFLYSWYLIHGLRWSGLIKAEPGSRAQFLKFKGVQILKLIHKATKNILNLISQCK